MIKTSLTYKEITAMKDAAACLRDKVIISFYADTGCRCSELLKIKVRDVDLKAGQVMIPHLKHGTKKKCPKCGKTAGRAQSFCSYCGQDLSRVQAEGIKDRKRLIGLGEDSLAFLTEYLNGMPPDEPIIQLSRRQVYNIVRNCAAAAGLTGKAILNPETGRRHYVHPHNFRDSLAVDWLADAGADVNKQKALQEYLGHARFETTMRYNKLAPSEVKKTADEVRRKRKES